MTDVSVAEGFLSELADGNADRYEERQWIEDDQPSTATEENIIPMDLGNIPKQTVV